VILLAGLAMLLHALWLWHQAHFGLLQSEDNLRRLIPAGTLIVLGIQVIFSSFFMSVLGLKTVRRLPPAVEP
jgi:drug/metabolite transporter (DMT)-like permease